MMRVDIALRALATALAGMSVAFAVYMLTHGGGRLRINGMEYLAIFAQPRGSAPAKAPEPSSAAMPVDLEATGSLAVPGHEPAAAPPPVEIVAARADKVWFRIDGRIVAAAPGDDVPRVGHLAAIVARDGGWAVLGDKGETLMAVSKGANAAPLFARKLMFK
ncbi:MAG TPA: hypothetical protein VMI72_04620 [Roseiarcus sp.]|nr:hypothetical protein [Roseiarcus sp.]